MWDRLLQVSMQSRSSVEAKRLISVSFHGGNRDRALEFWEMQTKRTKHRLFFLQTSEKFTRVFGSGSESAERVIEIRFLFETGKWRESLGREKQRRERKEKQTKIDHINKIKRGMGEMKSLAFAFRATEKESGWCKGKISISHQTLGTRLAKYLFSCSVLFSTHRQKSSRYVLYYYYAPFV